MSHPFPSIILVHILDPMLGDWRHHGSSDACGDGLYHHDTRDFLTLDRRPMKVGMRGYSRRQVQWFAVCTSFLSTQTWMTFLLLMSCRFHWKTFVFRRGTSSRNSV